MKLEPEHVYDLLMLCEKYVVVDDLNSFYACIDNATKIKWKHTDVVMFDDEGHMIRLLAYAVVGDEVLSVLAYYNIDQGSNPTYSGFDVDLSPLEDVKRILGDI